MAETAYGCQKLDEVCQKHTVDRAYKMFAFVLEHFPENCYLTTEMAVDLVVIHHDWEGGCHPCDLAEETAVAQN